MEGDFEAESLGPVATIAWYPVPKSRRGRLAIPAISENDLARNAPITKTSTKIRRQDRQRR